MGNERMKNDKKEESLVNQGDSSFLISLNGGKIVECPAGKIKD